LNIKKDLCAWGGAKSRKNGQWIYRRRCHAVGVSDSLMSMVVAVVASEIYYSVRK